MIASAKSPTFSPAHLLQLVASGFSLPRRKSWGWLEACSFHFVFF